MFTPELAKESKSFSLRRSLRIRGVAESFTSGMKRAQTSEHYGTADVPHDTLPAPFVDIVSRVHLNFAP